jgi:ABC-2 type transport system ATP-binding protein
MTSTEEAADKTTDTAREGPAIQCESLSLRRGRWTTVLNDINLSIPTGAVVGLVGRNGAGKTTLMQCLVGLTVPSSGQCHLLGEDALNLSDAVRDRLGYVAQSPDLFDWLTGHEHLRRFGALYSRWSERRAVELAAMLDLTLGKTAKNLSGGDQQKLSVVLALAHDPDLLILDEPVASLDPMTRRDFMRSLFERRDSALPPRTVLISSHLLTDLERVVTHVAFMHEGRIQLFDEWDALTEHVRVLELPVGSSAMPTQALHRRTIGDRERVLFDRRVSDAPPGSGHALSLDELFVELNRQP